MCNGMFISSEQCANPTGIIKTLEHTIRVNKTGVLLGAYVSFKETVTYPLFSFPTGQFTGTLRV